jgi:Icc-related predicted phosphoesterase
MPVRPPWPDGAVNADGTIVEVAGLRLAGLGGCRRYSGGPNQYTDRQFARRARALRLRAWRQRRRVDVLLTHAAPRGTGDGSDPPHLGFAALPGLVAALEPVELLHGHVRPSEAEGGQRAGPRGRQLGRTAVRNVTGRHLLDILPGGGAATQPLPGSCRAR